MLQLRGFKLVNENKLAVPTLQFLDAGFCLAALSFCSLNFPLAQFPANLHQNCNTTTTPELVGGLLHPSLLSKASPNILPSLQSFT